MSDTPTTRPSLFDNISSPRSPQEDRGDRGTARPRFRAGSAFSTAFWLIASVAVIFGASLWSTAQTSSGPEVSPLAGLEAELASDAVDSEKKDVEAAAAVAIPSPREPDKDPMLATLLEEIPPPPRQPAAPAIAPPPVTPPVIPAQIVEPEDVEPEGGEPEGIEPEDVEPEDAEPEDVEPVVNELESESESPPVVARDVDEPPVRLYGPKPQYPPGEWLAAIEGDVTLKASIDENGRVAGVEVVQGLSPELDQAAVAALRQWRFKPARSQGVAVAADHVLTFRFTL